MQPCCEFSMQFFKTSADHCLSSTTHAQPNKKTNLVTLCFVYISVLSSLLSFSEYLLFCLLFVILKFYYLTII